MPKYATADGGNGICRSLRLSEIIHTYDITHKIALILKSIYNEYPLFAEYTTELAKMRTALVLSNVSHVLPPKQRVNSRFMNLDILSDWGCKVLFYLKRCETNSHEIKIETIKAIDKEINQSEAIEIEIEKSDYVSEENDKVETVEVKIEKSEDVKKEIKNVEIKIERTKVLGKEIQKVDEVEKKSQRTKAINVEPNKEKTVDLKAKKIKEGVLKTSNEKAPDLENETIESNEYQKLKCISKYEELIIELREVNHIINQIKTKVKINGLSDEINKEIKEDILQKIIIKNSRTDILISELEKYLAESKNSLPKEEKILCTSDIIESSFGKYKNYISDNPMIGITNLALCLSTFTSKLEPNEIKEGLEKTKMIDLKEWTEKNIAETNMKKRKNILKKNGVKLNC